MQRTVVRAWLTLTGATLVMLLLRNPYTGSGELSDAFDLAGLRNVLETKTGAALTSRLLLLGAAALFVAVLFGSYTRRTDPKEKRDLVFGLGVGGTVVATGIAGTWALAEHASTGIQPGIAMPVDILHLSPWPPGSAASPCCWWPSTGRPPSNAPPSNASPRSPSPPWPSSRPPGSTSPGARSVPGPP